MRLAEANELKFQYNRVLQGAERIFLVVAQMTDKSGFAVKALGDAISRRGFPLTVVSRVRDFKGCTSRVSHCCFRHVQSDFNLAILNPTAQQASF